MIIDAVLNPAEIALLPGRDLSATSCVVFDVLRATSSMLTGLAHGVLEIRPARTIEEAWELKAEFPEAILGGERHGERIDGFDVGNSPFEYRELAGKTVISTTTNGTLALRACERAERVWVGALVNLAALAEAVRAARPERLLLVCAGTFADFALEDAYAAGRLISLLHGEGTLTDSALAAWAVARMFPEPAEALRSAKNGRALAAKGRDPEVLWCAAESCFEVVGSMREGVIRALPPAGTAARNAEPVAQNPARAC
jgi:2-phosphosulfolactate phosphatase